MATSPKGALKSAIITGGASGMGLEVAKALTRRGEWSIHLLDVNVDRSNQAAADVNNATFHNVDLLNYDQLSKTFQRIYDIEDRLDFVFANAGIATKSNFYKRHPSGRPPPPPDHSVIDINLGSVLDTVWLAQHYFHQSTISTDKNIVITASSGALYPLQTAPDYIASKHAVLGLMRSIAPAFYKQSVRVNAICPASVGTNLLDSAVWDKVAPEWFVPIAKIADTVLMLMDGHDVGGSVAGSQQGDAVGDGARTDHKLYGKTVELSGSNYYYRDQPEYCDDIMERCMQPTEKETPHL